MFKDIVENKDLYIVRKTTFEKKMKQKLLLFDSKDLYI